MKKTYLIIILLFPIFCLAESTSITLHPPRFVADKPLISLKPYFIEFYINFFSNEKELLVDVYTECLAENSRDNQLCPPDEWFSITPKKFKIGKNNLTSQRVKLKIKIPKNVPAEKYQTILIFKPTNNENNNPTIKISTQVGAVIEFETSNKNANPFYRFFYFLKYNFGTPLTASLNRLGFQWNHLLIIFAVIGFVFIFKKFFYFLLKKIK